MAAHDPKVVEQMGEDVVALITAWTDRGISPADSAMVMAAISHRLIMGLTEFTFGEFIQLALEQWKKYGGAI